VRRAIIPGSCDSGHVPLKRYSLTAAAGDMAPNQRDRVEIPPVSGVVRMAGNAARLVPPPSASATEHRVNEQHPLAPHHLPGFITAPGDTDILMVVVGIILVGSVLMVGNFYLHLHTMPERMAHKSQKLQFEIVAVLGLLALFTHIHLFWVAGLLLAMIDLPDFGTPLRRIAGSVEKMAGVPPGDDEVPRDGESNAHGPALEAPDTAKPGAAKSEVTSHA
jgi:hypothetical protein